MTSFTNMLHSADMHDGEITDEEGDISDEEASMVDEDDIGELLVDHHHVYMDGLQVSLQKRLPKPFGYVSNVSVENIAQVLAIIYKSSLLGS